MSIGRDRPFRIAGVWQAPGLRRTAVQGPGRSDVLIHQE